MSAQLSICVCYAQPSTQTLIELRLPVGATVRDAIEASGIVKQHPEIELETAKVGVYGKLKPLDAPLADQDRVEIYRPLIVDPKLPHIDYYAGATLVTPNHHEAETATHLRVRFHNAYRKQRLRR